MAASGQGREGRPRLPGPRGGMVVSHPVRPELVPVLRSASLSYFSLLCSSGRQQLQEGERARTRGHVSWTHVLKAATSVWLGPLRKERLPGPPRRSNSERSPTQRELLLGSCCLFQNMLPRVKDMGDPVSSCGSRCRDSAEGPRPSVRGGLPPPGPPGATIPRKNIGCGTRRLYLANTLFIN